MTGQRPTTTSRDVTWWWLMVEILGTYASDAAITFYSSSRFNTAQRYADFENAKVQG